jgi:flagellar biosynthetic protein FlhB
MMEAVPTADVIATNPTHFAVALKYDADSMQAPRIVAKGADLVAARIRRIAEEHGVPLFEHPPLAQALYFNVKLGAEIPPRLYAAVAQVLTYVYRLRRPSGSMGAEVERPDVEIDPDLLRHPGRTRLEFGA